MKHRNWLKAAAAALAAAMVLAGCSSAPSSSSGGSNSSSGNSSGETQGVDTSEKVDLVFYLLYEAPTDTAPLEEASKLLEEKCNASVEFKYTGLEGQAYQLLFTSGEEFDLVYVGTDNYSKLAKDGALVDLKDMLETYAPQTMERTPEDMWKSATINGGIYAVPCRFTEYIPTSIVYRGDLLEKYGMDEIDSLEDLEEYFDNVLANEDIIPFTPYPGWQGYYMQDMFLGLTDGWLPMEMVGMGGIQVACESKDNPKEIFYPAFTDEFVDFAKRMKEWNDKGYWQKDILSLEADPATEFMAGKTAAYFNHTQGYIGTYSDLIREQPDSDPRIYTFAEGNQKIYKNSTMANSTAISITSKKPERALYALDFMMNDKEINQLLLYGVEDVNYALDENGKLTKPDNYDEAAHGYSFANWNLRVDENLIPAATDFPGGTAIYEEYGEFSFIHPYDAFVFDNTNVSNQITACTQVNSQLGQQILFGKVDDPEAAVEEYRQQLKTAGIDQILEEVKAQVEDYTPIQ